MAIVRLIIPGRWIYGSTVFREYLEPGSQKLKILKKMCSGRQNSSNPNHNKNIRNSTNKLWTILYNSRINKKISRQMHTIDFIRHKILITPQICWTTKKCQSLRKKKVEKKVRMVQWNGHRPVDYSRTMDLRIYRIQRIFRTRVTKAQDTQENVQWETE